MLIGMGYVSLVVVVDGGGAERGKAARTRQGCPRSAVGPQRSGRPGGPAKASNAPGALWGPVERFPAQGRVPERQRRPNGRKDSEDGEGKKTAALHAEGLELLERSQRVLHG